MDEPLADQGVGKVDVELEELLENLFMGFVEMLGELVEPRFHLHFPAERSRLHVDHTASRNLLWQESKKIF